MTASRQEKAGAVEASKNVASNATASAKEVASEAGNQLGDVVAQSKQQLSSLVDQTKGELSSQLDQRASQAATGLSSLSTQLQALAEGRTYEAGALADYVRDAQQRVQGVATRLDERGAQGLLEDVTAFARRRPVAFLAATAVAGFVVGRVVRAGGAAASNGEQGVPTLATRRPTLDLQRSAGRQSPP